MKKNLPTLRGANLFLTKITALALSVFILQACSKEDLDKLTKGSIGTDIAMPLINSTLYLKDFLKKDTTGVIKEDANKYLTIVYSGEPFVQSANELMKFDSITANFQKDLPSGLPGGTAPVDIKVTQSSIDTASFTNSDGVEIEQVKIKSGDLIVSLESDFHFSAEVEIVFKGLKYSNGSEVSVKLPFVYDKKNVKTYKTSTVSIENTVLDLSLGRTTSNHMPFEYIIRTDIKAGDTYNPSQKIRFKMKFNELDFSYVDGYFGSLPLDMADKMTIGIFNNLLSGQLTLENPKMDLTISNSYGIPIDVTIDSLKTVPADKNAMAVDLKQKEPSLNGTISLPAPTKPYETKSQIIHLSNSLKDAIASSPKQFIYGATIKANPNGKIVGQRNFVTDSSEAKIKVDLEIPLYGTAANFATQDTFDFNMGESLESLQSAIFKVTTQNKFPVDVFIQLYFMDSNYVKLDSLITDGKNLLNAGKTNGNGVVITPSSSSLSIEISDLRLANVIKAKKIILKGILDSSRDINGKYIPIRITSDNSLKVNLGVRTKIKINPFELKD